MSQSKVYSTRPLMVASQYGASGSSTRVRLYDWLDHFMIDADAFFEYRGTGSNAPTALLRDARNTFRAERQMRALSHAAENATVVLSRELSPLSTGASEGNLLRRAARGIYDFDDALYAPLPGVPFGRLLSRKRLWARAVSTADLVIAGSAILADCASAKNENVVMIPSCVEPNKYRVKRDFELGAFPVAVWIGSPATEPYLETIATPLLEAHRKTGLRLKVISAGERDLGELNIMVERVRWSAQGFTEALHDADFGIMPLPDNEWTRGKCAYKLLQYGATGIPVIGSAVGANIEVLQMLGGIAPRSVDEWADGLLTLSRHTRGQREQLGRQAREATEQHFSYAAWADTWAEAVGLEMDAS